MYILFLKLKIPNEEALWTTTPSSRTNQEEIIQLILPPLTSAFSGVSLVTITVISLDWFATLHYHMRYAVIVTKRGVILLLVTIWLMNFLPFGLNLLNRSLHVILSSVVVILSLSTSSLSYIRIFQIVQRHQIDAQQQALQCAAPGLNMIRVKKSSINHFRKFYFFNLMLFSYVYFSDSLWKVK